LLGRPFAPTLGHVLQAYIFRARGTGATGEESLLGLENADPVAAAIRQTRTARLTTFRSVTFTSVFI
jgi:hypothetical protein